MERPEFDCFARLNEIANMFALITGETFDKAFDIVLSTEYGKTIASNNPVVMYEQTTENLRAIAEELNQSDLFTIEKITDVYLNGDFRNLHTMRTTFAPAQELKEKHKRILSCAKRKRRFLIGRNASYDRKQKRALALSQLRENILASK